MASNGYLLYLVLQNETAIIDTRYLCRVDFENTCKLQTKNYQCENGMNDRRTSLNISTVIDGEG
jgi:hypothetical protein